MRTERKIRLWPVVCIAAASGAALAVIWLWPEEVRQRQHLRTLSVASITLCALLLWLLFLSRLPWRIRLGGFVAVAALGVTAALSFEIRGVDGDLLPIIEPRWKPRHSVAASAPAAAPAPSRAWTDGNFPQFYGPDRNASLPGPALETDWTAHPPQVLWRQPVGLAWSGFAVQDGKAVTTEQRGESEYLICYDVVSGATLWTHATDAKYSTTIAGEGPRATPAISGGRVFSLGATGILTCLDFETGQLLWSRNAAAENDAKLPDWGFASSPLVAGGNVIVSIGGSSGRAVVAYGAGDGRPAWSSGDGGADYSSPLEAVILGSPQIILFAARVEGRAMDGRVLWSYPWRGGHPHITPPLVISSNLLFVSSGYGTGCELLELSQSSESQWSVASRWKSIALKSKFGPLFHAGDSVYGLDDGIFACVDLRTGQRRWKDGRYGHGQGLLVGGLILVTSEKGEIILVQPDPERLIELARFKVFDDKTWNPPALAGKYLLLRSDKEAACLVLSLRPAEGTGPASSAGGVSDGFPEENSAKNLRLSVAKRVSHR